jgi:hypothetical protein
MRSLRCCDRRLDLQGRGGGALGTLLIRHRLRLWLPRSPRRARRIHSTPCRRCRRLLDPRRPRLPCQPHHRHQSQRPQPSPQPPRYHQCPLPSRRLNWTRLRNDCRTPHLRRPRPRHSREGPRPHKCCSRRPSQTAKPPPRRSREVTCLRWRTRVPLPCRRPSGSHGWGPRAGAEAFSA